MPNLVPSSEDNRIYEICVLLPYPMNQKEEQDAHKEVEGIFAEAEGRQVAKDSWGRRGIAYTIKGYNEGSYVIYYYEIDPSKITEIDEALRIAPKVLRHMIVIPPKGYEIVEYGEKYKQWLKERESESEKRDKSKEEKLQKQVVERAKREVRKAEEQKKDAKEAKKPMEEKSIEEGLEKLISDSDIDI